MNAQTIEKYKRILSGMMATLTAASLAATALTLGSCGGGDAGETTVKAGSAATSGTGGDDPANPGDKDYKSPNVVMILLDDTGVAEFGCYGNTFNETPNIDRICSEGTKFTQYYTQPVCSPARSCLMTGEGTLRTGIMNFLDAPNTNYLDNEEFTLLPQLLKDNGYQTGIIGKWHLAAGYDPYPAPGSPYDAGWDTVLYSEQKQIGGEDFFYPYYHLPQVTDGKEGDYLVDVMDEAALDYIEKAAKEEEPFFLLLSHYATHTVLDAPQESVNYFQKKRGSAGTKTDSDRNPYLAAMLKHVDNGVGKIDALLGELGIAENTIFIITSDNGGEPQVTENGIYRGGKRQIYEGGLLDPLIIRWPARGQSAATVDFPVSIIDFYQTLGEAAGIAGDKIPENSGVSMLPLITGSGVPDRDTLYWIYLRTSTLSEKTVVTNSTILEEGVAIRVGDYKYLESLAFYRRELYNIKNDPGEQINLIDNYPGMAAVMAMKLHTLLKADAVGKTFSAAFGTGEVYRWSKSGTVTRNNGSFSTGADTVCRVIREDGFFYDSEITCELKVGGTGRAGIVLRNNLVPAASPYYTSYAVTLDAKNGRASLLNVRGELSCELAGADAAITPGKLYTLKVVSDSDEIKVYLDGRLVLTAYDESCFHGSYGLYSEQCAAVFESLSVVGIQSKRPITAKQINLATGYANNIKADGHWQINEPELKGEILFADATELLGSLGRVISVENGGKGLSAAVGKTELKLSADSKTVTLGGSEHTLAVSPYMKGDRLYIPLYEILDMLPVGYSVSGTTVSVSTAGSEKIASSDARIKYSGSWTASGSIYRSSAAGDSAELEFTGSGVKVYFDRGRYGGIFEVYIDGALVTTADAYNNGSITHSVVFEKAGLENGKHTLKIVNTGNHRSEGLGTNVNINEIEISKY